MPDFNEGGFQDILGEVVADSGDEDIVSEDDEVLSEFHLVYDFHFILCVWAIAKWFHLFCLE